MNRKRRILIVDDLERWREQLSETLQEDGFHVNSVSTAEEVLHLLEESFYHLLLLDVRLVDSDLNNQDGIDLLGELEKRGLSEGTKVIILSAHGTPEQMRQAFRDYSVSDFISKGQLSRQILLESVERVFSREVNINLDLKLHWQRTTGPEQVVVNLDLNGTRIKHQTPLQSYIAIELEDLLCRLFHDAVSVLLRPLTTGLSGAGVLWAQPFYPTGGGHPVIVKFGDVHMIGLEHSNFKRYVQPFIGGSRNTTVMNYQNTSHLGGLVYSLLGADNDLLLDFGNYYRQNDNSVLKDVLDQLFLETCAAWYANPGQLEPCNLTDSYQQMFGLSLEKLEHALSGMHKSVQGKQVLRFKALHGEGPLTNPLLTVAGPPFVRSTYTCTTHGDFNQHNLLVDATKHTWLIDFQRTGPGHILRDVAQLDSQIRFSLLAPQEATLEERLSMERALCGIKRFNQVERLGDNFSTTNQALAKAYTATIHLRTLALKLVAQNPGNDMSEYYIALFYNALNFLRFHVFPSIQREHALLSASLLADRLEREG